MSHSPDIDTTAQPLRGLWWLDPTIMFALLGLGTTLVALLSPEEFFAYHNSPKHVTWYHFGLALLATGGFTIGSLYGRSFSPGEPDTRIADRRWLWWWFLLAITLTVLGYTIWTAVAINNNLSFNIIKELLSGSDANAFSQLKEKIFVRIPGVTTATQFGMSAMLLGIVLWKRGEKLALWMIVALLMLSAARALLFSERLALIELVLPSTILWVRYTVLGNRLPAWKVSAWKLAPVGGLVSLVMLFGSFEYFRSWTAHQEKHDSIVEFTLMRLSGYYNLAVNSCVMQIDQGQQFPVPWSTAQFLWQFPLVKMSPLSYTSLTGREPDEELWRMLELYANPELNNDGGLLLPYFDYGTFGLPVFWAIIGVGVGYVYRCFQAGRLTGLVLYPMMFIGILEVPRIMYFTSQRAFPSLFLLIAFAFYLRYQLPHWLGNGEPATRERTATAH